MPSTFVNNYRFGLNMNAQRDHIASKNYALQFSLNDVVHHGTAPVLHSNPASLVTGILQPIADATGEDVRIKVWAQSAGMAV